MMTTAEDRSTTFRSFLAPGWLVGYGQMVPAWAVGPAAPPNPPLHPTDRESCRRTWKCRTSAISRSTGGSGSR